MGWHSNGTGRKGRKAQSTTKAACILNDLLRTNGGRKLSEAEMYSRLYFSQRVRPLVAEANLKRNPQTRGEKLAIIRECTKVAWESETDATIIAEVKHKLQEKVADKETEELTEEEMLELVTGFVTYSSTYCF